MKVGIRFPECSEGATVRGMQVYTLNKEEMEELTSKGEVVCHDEGEESVYKQSIIIRR